jgi:hypothetical protein
MSKYDLHEMPIVIDEDRVRWTCGCGSEFDIRIVRHDGGFHYELDEKSYDVTAGVGARCPACATCYFLPTQRLIPTAYRVDVKQP